MSPIPQRAFYFIRHGESEANKFQIMCGGGMDTPLTDHGRKQAFKSNEVLKQLPKPHPKIVFHSPLSRATDTALIATEHLTIPKISLSDLREHEMGAWEGRPWKEVCPKLDRGMDPEGGETFLTFDNRIKQVLSSILGLHDMPLIVAHGGLWHAFARLYGKKSTVWAENAGVYMFMPTEVYFAFPWKITLFAKLSDGSISSTDCTHIFV